MKKLALHWQILIGMFLGVLFGFIMSNTTFGSSFISDWIKPFGTMFINALKLIAMPLILGSLIKGVSDLKDISKLSIMGGRTIGIYLFTTVLAVVIGLILVNTIVPGNTITESTRNDLMTTYEGNAKEKVNAASEQKESGPLQPLVDLVPDNIFEATTSNINMLQVIFFAMFFGVALILIPEKKAKPVKDFFDSFNDVILKFIDLIMITAPYGIFALLAALVVESPSLDLFQALGMYAITLIIGLVILIVVYIILVKLFTGKSPLFFMKGISPAQLVAFSTSSSAATLPVTMERVEKHLGVDILLSKGTVPL